MRVKYIGPNIGIDGLFDNGVYEVLEVDEVSGALRIVDESGEDYLYSPVRPKAFTGKYKGGCFQIIEDDGNGTLFKAINN